MKSLQHLVYSFNYPNGIKNNTLLQVDAIIPEYSFDDTKEYWIYKHNETGPAEILGKLKWYFLYNKQLTKEEWEKQIKIINFDIKFEGLINGK